MLEINKVMLIGNLTRDPELKYLSSGTAVARLGLAVNRTYRDRNGENQEETAFVDIDAWARTAEFCAKYLKKGRRVYVEGRLKYDTWEGQDGSKRSKLSVTAERVQFADPPPRKGEGGSYGGSNQGGGSTSQGGDAYPDTDDSEGPPSDDSTADDLPF